MLVLARTQHVGDEQPDADRHERVEQQKEDELPRQPPVDLAHGESRG